MSVYPTLPNKTGLTFRGRVLQTHTQRGGKETGEGLKGTGEDKARRKKRKKKKEERGKHRYQKWRNGEVKRENQA